MQEEDSCVRAQAVLRIGCHLEDPCALVHVLDAILNGAEVSVGYRDSIPKVKLDVCPLEITLNGGGRGRTAVSQGSFTWSGTDSYWMLGPVPSASPSWGPRASTRGMKHPPHNIRLLSDIHWALWAGTMDLFSPHVQA